ncbi:MAG: hypothetical protein ACR2ID_04385 [Chthoniobacterales bacterium]
MSLTELKSEIAHLSAADLGALHSAIEAELLKKEPAEPTTFAEYAASLRGTMTLHPGWDDDEPLEQWNAERDDTPL